MPRATSASQGPSSASIKQGAGQMLPGAAVLGTHSTGSLPTVSMPWGQVLALQHGHLWQEGHGHGPRP